MEGGVGDDAADVDVGVGGEVGGEGAREGEGASGVDERGEVEGVTRGGLPLGELVGEGGEGEVGVGGGVGGVEMGVAYDNGEALPVQNLPHLQYGSHVAM